MSNSSKALRQRELRDNSKTTDHEIADLRNRLAASEAREKESNEQLQETKVLLNEAMEMIEYLKRKLFGRSSEARVVDGQLTMDIFNEVEMEADKNPLEEEECETELVQFERKKKSKTTNEEKLKGLPVKKHLIVMPEAERICKECGSKMLSAGPKFIRRELVYVPAKLYVREIYAETYYCPECKKESTKADSDTKNNLVTTKVPSALIPGSMATETLVAHSIYQKYADAVPLYRQEKDWQQIGAFLTRARLASWINVCSEKYFAPLYDYFHRLLLGRGFAMADETRIQVLKEEGRNAETNSFMWLFRSGEDGLPPLILYHYTETRAKYNAVDFLKGFKGYLMTDGYQGYNNLPEIIRLCCWAHVRRDYYDAIPKSQKGDLSHPAVQGLMYCDKLFAVERHCRERGFTAEQRYEYRLKHAKPILEAFWAWLDLQLKNPALDPKSRLGQALTYTLNRKPYLDVYLQDGRCSFSNNPSENSIRPFVVGRKNWLFCDTPKGARASAIIYTIVEMAKAHDINVERYLVFLLKNRPSMDMKDEELERFAPWGTEAKEYCSRSHEEEYADDFDDLPKSKKSST